MQDLLNSDKIRSKSLRDYVEMVRRHFEHPYFSVGGVAQLLYKLKQVERKGWLARHLPVRESVAEHTFGAVILGMVYLPTRNTEWPEYDKRTVLRMLFAHDLAESITGDLLPKHKTEALHEEERSAYRYIGLLSTYTQIEGTRELHELFESFEHNSTTNSKIANDLDTLDNLMQLYVFRDKFNDVESFAAFKRELIDDIRTEAGQQILRIILTHFDEK